MNERTNKQTNNHGQHQEWQTPCFSGKNEINKSLDTHMYVGTYETVLAEFYSEMINSIVNAISNGLTNKKHLFLTHSKLLCYFSYNIQLDFQ